MADIDDEILRELNELDEGTVLNSTERITVLNSTELISLSVFTDVQVATPRMEEWPDCSSVEVLLALNEAYSELVSRVINRVEKALEVNKKRQKAISTKQRSQKENDLSSKKKVPVTQYLPPYFKDDNMMCPPLSNEAKRKMNSTTFDPLMKEEKRWTAAELKLLTGGVKSSLRVNKLQPLLDKREVVHDKIKRSGVETKDFERKMLITELEIIDRKIAYIRTIPDNELFDGDYTHVDWAKIASVDFRGSRTPTALRLKWVNEQCPRYNKGAWSKQELTQLKTLREGRFVSWAIVADKLGTRRSPWQCFEKYKSELWENAKEWTAEEDEKLIALVNMLKINGKIQWDKVTYYMPGRHRQQVRTRYLRSLDKTVKHGRWTDQEDLLLMCAVGRLGAKDWARISKAVPGRSDGQCRERWANVLDKKIRGTEWTLEEDEKLLFAVDLFGKGAWSNCSQILTSRTPKQCRSRYQSLLATKMRLCTAQLDSIKRSTIASRNQSVVRNLRRNKIYRMFNEMVDGNDETGDAFCDRVAESTNIDPTPGMRAAVTRSANAVPETMREVVSKKLEEIHNKYKKGDSTRHVVDLMQSIPLTDLDVEEMMSQKAKNAARRVRVRHAKRNEPPKHGDATNTVKRIRPNVYLLSDVVNAKTKFDDDVPEDSRVLSLSEALVDTVRKYDQYTWNLEICEVDHPDVFTGTTAARNQIQETLSRKTKDAAMALMMGERPENDSTLAPNVITTDAFDMFKKLQPKIRKLASIFHGTGSAVHPTSSASSPSVAMNSDNYAQVKALVRALFLEPARLDVAIEKDSDDETNADDDEDVDVEVDVVSLDDSPIAKKADESGAVGAVRQVGRDGDGEEVDSDIEGDLEACSGGNVPVGDRQVRISFKPTTSLSEHVVYSSPMDPEGIDCTIEEVIRNATLAPPSKRRRFFVPKEGDE